MDESQGVGRNPLTVVERSLRYALDTVLRTASDTPLGTTTISLGWPSTRLDSKGPVPEAVVTWTGHGAGGHRPAHDLGVDVVARDALDSDELDPGELNPDAVDPDALDPDALTDLTRLPVGASLVAALTGVEVADADDAELLDVAARWQDIISWATAMQSRATSEIARRRGWTTEHTTAAAEISARLRIPQTDANKLMARGTSLTQ
ncbi:hypothetical protein, partial [Promicromonospora sp. NPDC050262]|uniref:hypothetical protein n=1 Tax=Promicromonospora sp. NPDC050262 TaxID=3155036 RepID=UPI0033D44CE0